MTTNTPWSSLSWADYSAGKKPGTESDAAQKSPFDQTVELLAAAEASLKATVQLKPAADGAGPGVAYLDSVVRAYAAGPERRLAQLSALKQPEAMLDTGEQWTANLAEAFRQTWLAETLTRNATGATGNLDALESANKSLATLSTMGGAELVVARANIAKGRVYAWRGETLRATEALNTALAAASLLGNDEVLAEVAYELGVAYRDQRRFDVALPLFRVSERVLARAGREPQTARARQGLALALIGFAKMSPQSAPVALVEARALARQVFDFGLAQGDEGKPKDVFRAIMAARDLAEIALILTPNDTGDESAQGWLQCARQIAYGSDPRIDPTRSLYEQIFLPAFGDILSGETKSRGRATRPLDFEDLRLVEIEARLEPDVSLRDAGIRLEQIYLMWEQRRLPTYAIEALLWLADVYRGVLTADSAGNEARWRARNGEARARFLAYERALAMNANLRSLPDGFTTDFTDTEKEICKRLGGAPVMLLREDGVRRTLRIDLEGQTVPARLSIVPTALLAGTSKDAELIACKLKELSQNHPSLPRFLDVGVTGDVAWFVDEERIGRPLSVMALRAGMNDFRSIVSVLEELATTLRALHFTGLSQAWIDPSHILIQPGWRPVITLLGPMQLGMPISGDAQIYRRSTALDANENAIAIARLAALVLNKWENGAIERTRKGGVPHIFEKGSKSDALKRLVVEVLNGKPRKLEALIDACAEVALQWPDSMQ